MAFEAKIVVALDEELGVDRAVRVVADGAAFAQSFVLEDKWFGLLAMTLGAGLVEARHREAAGGFQDVGTVGIVALDAIHPTFKHGVMLRQIEFSVGFQMAVEAGGRIFAGVQNKFAATTAGFDVFAAGAMTGFATTRSGFRVRGKVQAGVSARGKGADVVGVTGEAGLITGEMSAGNFGGNDDLSRGGDAGVEQRQNSGAEAESEECCRPTNQFPVPVAWGLGRGKHLRFQTVRTGFDQLWQPHESTRIFFRRAWRRETEDNPTRNGLMMIRAGR